MAEPAPRTGTYTRRQRLAEGAHAEVWLADGLRGQVALKVATTAAGRELIQNEARVLDGLNHPSLVHLEARDPGGAWLAVEYVDGGPLDAWAMGRSPKEIAEVLARVADGLAFVHAHGIIHGDLKPSNVLVDADGRPRIIDFELASSSTEAVLGFRGTLGYAAPELLQGGAPGAPSDLYALGALAYQVTTGRLPFEAADPAAQAVLPLNSLPVPPSAWVPALPQQLGELVLRLLARSPAIRPRDASLVASALRACAEGTPGPVVVGMHRERAALRRLVVQASDGAAAMVVVHGPVGSGRSTLIREAIEAARREDLQLLRHQPGGTGPLAAEARVAESILVEARRRRSVIVLDAGSPEGERLAARLYAQRLPGLVLARAERPASSLLALGARHLSPPPLQQDEVELLLEALGQDPEQAAELLRLSGGRPAAIRTIVGRQDLPTDISDRERAILLATSRGAVEVRALAREMGLGEHDLLDLVDPLLERGLLAESADGSQIERTG